MTVSPLVYARSRTCVFALFAWIWCSLLPSGQLGQAVHFLNIHTCTYCVRQTPFASPISVLSLPSLQVREQDVELIYNRDGRPAGIAFVTFANRGLADRAISEKDGKHIGRRYVELSMAS